MKKERSDAPAARPQQQSRRTKSPDEALAALMRLCARAEKSEGDARRLMRGWGVAEADIERVVARLVRDRFIDDARYAEAFVREKVRLSGWGAFKIRTALRRKGISDARIDAALSQTDDDAMRQRLDTQLRRKAATARYATSYELKTKLIRYGLSLGYDYDAVRDAATALVKQTNPHDECDLCDEF